MYGYALVFFDKYLILQLMVINIGSLMMFVYLVTIRPFDSFFLNSLEIINECYILVLSYFCWIFTDYLIR